MIYIADPEILAIQIKECNELLIDIKEYDELLYGSPPECELTKDCYTKMRSTVYKKLVAEI
jgi:D-alanyl-D-alanine dipeptidase